MALYNVKYWGILSNSSTLLLPERQACAGTETEKNLFELLPWVVRSVLVK